jgi:aspartate/methionine/tyrosine aminotransferase
MADDTSRQSNQQSGRQSRRVAAVQSPVIPDVAALIRQHPGTISLGQGVVHYAPPPQSFAAVASLGRTAAEHHYQAAMGLPQLQDGLRAKLEVENGIQVGADQAVVVTAGSNMAFYHAVLSIADPGDEIILMSPFYFNHEMAVVMANCKPVLVPTDADYQLRLEAIEAAIGPRTRAVVTISPNNPTGAVYDPEALARVNRLCRERGIYHIADEAYEYFVYDGARHFSSGSLPDTAEHTLSLFSFSKSYSLANWRVGYGVIPIHLLRAFEKVQDTILICPPVVSQRAALGALEAGPDYCRGYVEGLARTRRLCLARLEALGPRCRVAPVKGAFYLPLQLDCPEHPMRVVERLVRDFGVAAIPGTAFGWDKGCYLRIAYGALEPDAVAAGMDRLIKGIEAVLDTSEAV